MRFRIPFKLPLILALVISSVVFIGARTLHRTRNSSVPVVFSVSPTNPAPNTQVTFTVELDAPSVMGQIVTIGCTDPNAFLDLPTAVAIPAGSTSATFTATTSSAFTDWSIIAATSNGGTA